MTPYAVGADGHYFTLYQGNLLTAGAHLETVPTLREAVDVACFSPPYKKKDGYSTSLMFAAGEALGYLLKPGGWVFMNFAQLSEGLEEDRPNEAMWELIRGARSAGVVLKRHQTIIWVKSYSPGPPEPCRGHCQPLNSPNLLNYSWEYIFTAYRPLPNGAPPDFDRLAVGVHFADKTNLDRGDRGKNGDLRCAGDVWVEPYQTTGAGNKKSHVYEWPAGLVERMIRVSGVKPGSLVLDLFMGAGQTACVAKRLGMNALGFELSEERALLAIKRWLTAHEA